MQIQINLDSEDFNKDTLPHRLNGMRSLAYFLLHSIGDIPAVEGSDASDGNKSDGFVNDSPGVAPKGTNPSSVTAAPPPPPMPPPPPLPRDLISSGVIPPPPPSVPTIPPPPSHPMTGSDDDENEAPSNVVNGNFPQAGSNPPPPPPPSADTAAQPSTSSATSAPAAAAAPNVASAEVDTAGMPWDERIHQSGKGTKKDGTWKLKKLFNSTPEKEAEFLRLVQAVTAEAAARKGAAAPVSSTVSVPPGGGNSVPVPPVPPAAPASQVPPPPPPGSTVPVPPSPAAGSLGPYRALIDKITDLTRANKISAAKVMEMCTRNGAPNLMQLNNMPHLVEAVDKDIDLAVLGLL